MLTLFVFLDEILQIASGRAIERRAHIVACDHLWSVLIVMLLVFSLHHVGGRVVILLSVQSVLLLVVRIVD